MKPSIPPRNFLRQICLVALLATPFIGCERKPTVEEIESARRTEEAARATPVPTPKPGEWMYQKDRKTKLDEKPRR